MKRNPYQKDRKTNNSNGFLFRKSNPRSLYQCQNKKTTIVVSRMKRKPHPLITVCYENFKQNYIRLMSMIQRFLKYVS